MSRKIVFLTVFRWVVIVVILFFQGCIVVKTQGFYTGYDQLSDAEKQSVVFLEPEASLCGLLNDGKIYSIHASHLHACLSQNDTSVVYQWSPHCSSEKCVLISSCQDYCNKHNYKLYVVADYYSMEMMNAQNVAKTPILVANHLYYKSNYCNKLEKRFKAELLKGGSSAKCGTYDRFLVFKGDRLVRSKSDLFQQ